MISRVHTTRRSVLAGAGAAIFASSRPAWAQGVSDAAPLLQREIDKAARTGRVVALPPGVSHVSRLRLPADIRLIGTGHGSRLVAMGPGPMLTAERVESIAIQNVVLDGGGHWPGGDGGLVEASDIAELRFSDCSVEHVLGHGVKLTRCGGRIERTTFRAIAESALFATDSSGLSILDNRVDDCGNNGIQVWRSEKGDDGTVLRGNRLSRIRANRGGDGPYGNAISIFRAGGVVCEGNVIRSCAFTAIRDNAGSNAIIRGNNCADLGEVAIYVEFGFQGAVVEGNIVDGAAVGISITNFDQGGRLAICNGNVIRNIDRVRPQGHDAHGVGIAVEADTVVSGNAVDHAAGPGLLLGWGPALRNVVADANMLSDCDYGIAVSVAPGAGTASVTNNLIAGAKLGGIVGMAWDKVASGDLVAEAAKYPALSIAGNRIG